MLARIAIIFAFVVHFSPIYDMSTGLTDSHNPLMRYHWHSHIAQSIIESVYQTTKGFYYEYGSPATNYGGDCDDKQHSSNVGRGHVALQ